MKTSNLQTLKSHLARALAVSIVGALVSIEALAQQSDENHPCGPIAVPLHYGPYDYRTERARLMIVDAGHFTARVEALVSGQTGPLEGDLNYTLKASPNHHRALLSLLRYSARPKNKVAAGFDWPLECYFERALRFRKDDVVARLIYAQFLAQNKRTPEAILQLNSALAFGAENAFTQFNAGMIFFDLGEFDRALSLAHRTKAMGLMKPELEDRLKQASRWREPVEVAAEAAKSAAPTAASAASGASAGTSAANASAASASSTKTAASSASAPSN